jgi:Delta24-sterol reductase
MLYIKYKKKVRVIANQIKESNKLITTNRTGRNYRDLGFKNKQDKISTKNLNQILSCTDTYIDCESSVTTGILNRYTVPKKRMVPSLPEGSKFTIGGCLGGLALGSNGYINGFFNHNVIDFDIVLGNGDILENVSVNKNSDLFYGVGGTYGTMGIITRVKLKLIPCQEYVKIEYLHYSSFNNFYSNFKERINNKKDDLIEAFVNKKDDFTIVIANFVDSIDNRKLLDIHNPNHNFYKKRKICLYKQIAEKKKYNFLKTIDYLSRWQANSFFGLYMFTPYSLQDYLYIGIELFLAKKSILKNNNNPCNDLYSGANELVGNYERDEHVLVSDIGVPLSKLKDSLDLVDKMAKTYPLWICPIKDNYHPDKIFCTRNTNLCTDDIILDLGIYGIKNTNIPSKEINMAFEKFSFANGLFKGFFSTSHFTYEDFWNRFDKEQYEKLRKKYHADIKFMDIYDKITYRSTNKKTKKKGLRSKLFTFFGKKYLKSIKKNNLIKNNNI